MALPNKQVQYILKNRRKYSAKKLAKILNLEIEEIQKVLDENPLPKTPKSFYIVLVLIPIIFLILLEITLRVVNYGVDTSAWVDVVGGRKGLNPDFARRYFYNVENVPHSIQDTYLKVKPENSFRVFVLGGSSAAGYPYLPLGSFSRYVRKRLEIVYPNSTIEVVNVSLTAVNTYTIRDILPDVLSAQPDLILIYAGHNEFYGALGVGSLESLGRSRTIVNLILSLNKFKTVEMLRDFIQWTMKAVGGNEKPTGTLMARMAQDKAIPYKSDIFNDGIDQFEGNMDDILSMIKESGTHVIISNLACNLKGLAPFISEKYKNYPDARSVYRQAEAELSKGNITKADSLFRYAKDLDMLRFRAPEAINSSIKKLSEKYNIPMTNADSVFASLSPEHITGNNLMTDHLHPTLEGYQDLGEAFYNTMIATKNLPKTKPSGIPFEIQDRETRKEFLFSAFDSTIAAYKLKILKNDWPFVDKKHSVPLNVLLHPENYIDSLAFKFTQSKVEWEEAERDAAVYYLNKRDYKDFVNQLELLIYQYPMIPDYYNMIAEQLLKIGKYNEVYSFLLRRYKLKPDHFSTKWIGIINLSRNNAPKAITYLEKSLKFDEKDPQVLYNLSGAYAKTGQYKKALDTIEACLAISPDYNGAKILRDELFNIVNTGKK